MLENKKVIIFDMDGTLIDSIGAWVEVDKKLIKEITNNNTEIDDVISFVKMREEKLKEYSGFENQYLEYCGFLGREYKSNMTKEEIHKKRYELSNKYLEEEIDYKPNAEKVLKLLKENGFTLVIATTTGENALEKYKKLNKNIINKANLEDIFEAIYSKDSVKEKKPNPEVHYKIMEQFGVKNYECLIIEDSLMGVEAARNANIDVAVIYDKYADIDREEINRLSNYQFKDFNELFECLKKELNIE